jgi:carbonic anhydrase
VEKLVAGIHRFRSKITHHQAQELRKLAKGQKPLAMMITCADSRIIPNLIMQTDPGDLFILRNVGNIIPPYGTANNGEAAAIEFAVSGLGVRDIIVCGHTHCGAMKGLLKPELLNDLPTTREWLKHATATQAIMKENYPRMKGERLLTATAEENVLVQLQQLETMPVVAARCMRGNLFLHGWMYAIETGEVFEYDWESGQFTLMKAPGRPETADEHSGSRAKQASGKQVSGKRAAAARTQRGSSNRLRATRPKRK